METTNKDHVMGSVEFTVDYDHDLFMVNDKGEFNLTFIIDDLWPHVDEELQIFMIGDDKPKRWVFKECQLVRCPEDKKLLAVMRTVKQPRLMITLSEGI